ncbi:MAG: pyridoxamine 5'-phosphate oxidase family protein [Rikenellaceae bacterium]
MNDNIDKKVVTFLAEHHLMTLATTRDNIPHTANLFYHFDLESLCFIFTSQEETKHVKDVLKNNTVAMNVALETKNVAKIQGLQMTGHMRHPEGDDLKNMKKLYLKAVPLAVVMDLDIWVIDLDSYKFTDNTLGFGKKLLWNRG